MRLSRVMLLAVLLLVLPQCASSSAGREVPRTAFQGADSPQRAFTVEGTSTPWPLEREADPALAAMPASAQTSVASVAQYIRAHSKDKLALVRALHEWVASRIRYEDRDDAAGILAPRLDPPTDSAELLGRLFSRTDDAGPIRMHLFTDLDQRSALADATFARRNGVCAGYAALLEKLGEQAGVSIKYVHGSARASGSDGVEEGKHAWNIAEVDGRSYMIDVTWDAGSGGGREFRREYKTDYLFTPPDVFAMSHFPVDSEDLHTTSALTYEQFRVRALVEPRFYALGMRVDPASSKLGAHDVRVVIDDPLDIDLIADVRASGARAATCSVTGGASRVVDCPVDADARGVLHVWTSEARHAHLVATVELPLL
jgi:transglutaminase/protease-like cytokinesis protein 3